MKTVLEQYRDLTYNCTIIKLQEQRRTPLEQLLLQPPKQDWLSTQLRRS